MEILNYQFGPMTMGFKNLHVKHFWKFNTSETENYQFCIFLSSGSSVFSAFLMFKGTLALAKESYF